VTGTVNKTYAYDANGSMTSTAEAGIGTLLRSVNWSSFNKPVNIQAHDSLSASDFVYGPGRARVRQTVYSGGAPTKTITYIGGAFERHSTGVPGDELVHYIRAGSTVAIFTRVDDADPATDKTRYLHKDHLGSIALITDEAGLVAERRSFDAHGRLRGDDWTVGGLASGMAESKRGFTGHEHIDSVGLIHMNGRVYDPEIGRFLSADPFVQAPETTQSFNRYSYVNNNPLSATDPSGLFVKSVAKAIGSAFKAVGKFLKSIIPAIATIAVVALACAPTAGACAAWGAALLAAGMTGITTLSYGGSLSDALSAAAIAAGTALAFNAVGTAFQAMGTAATASGQAIQFVAKTAAHGLVGAVSSVLRGGKALAGFASAAFAHFASPVIAGAPGDRLGQSIAAAVVGGVGAELGGGKFKNGAVTGAFSYLFNQLGHNSRSGILDEVLPAEGTEVPPELRAKLEPIIDAAIRAAHEVDIQAKYNFWLRIPFIRGIKIHAVFARNLRAIGYHAEVSYQDHVPAKYGDPGSVGADTILNTRVRPEYAIDLKTGAAYITRGQFNRYQDHLPHGTKVIQLNVP